MKRTFEEISNENKSSGDGKSPEDILYGPELKRRKIDDQKIGDFIVDAKKSFYFRLTSNINKLEDQEVTSAFFSPIFTHLRVSGYEGLSIDITLSKKKLIPFVQINYKQKAPAFANIDNIQEKLEKHYGRVYYEINDFKQILEQEDNFKPNGEKLKELQMGSQSLSIYKVSLDDEAFHEQSFYLQSLLPFFIDGASMIEPSPFWKYFLIYDGKTQNLLAFATVFEAHLSAEKYRGRISQVLVLPPYQKQGLGALLYQTIYKHYRDDQPNCFQVIVEDAAEEFQRLQDYNNVKTFLKENSSLTNTLKKQPISNLIINENALEKLQLSKQEVYLYSEKLKLPHQIILRLNDIILYSVLDNKDSVQKAFRIQVKKRYYLTCVRDYISLFKNITNCILDQQGGLKMPYIYNDQMIEEDPFVRDSLPQDEERKNDKGVEAETAMTQEAVKIQLNTIYNEIISEYDVLKVKVKEYIEKGS